MLKWNLVFSVKLLLLLVLFYPPISWAQNRLPNVELMRITLPGTNAYYHIAKISIDGAYDPTGNKLAARLLSRAANFVIAEFEDRYPDVPRIFFEKMRAEGIEIGEASSMVVIFRGDDPDDVVATLRFAYPQKDGSIPLEHDLHWTYPRKPLDRRPWYGFDYQLGEIRDIESRGLALTGDPVEIKNLVVSRSVSEDLVPVLYFFAEESQLSSQGRWVLESEVPRGVMKKFGRNNEIGKMVEHRFITSLEIAQQYAKIGYKVVPSPNVTPGYYLLSKMVPEVNHAPYDELNPPKIAISPSEYVLECNRRMVPLYRRMGFHLVQDDPVSGDNYVMRISRVSYLLSGLSVMMERPGFQTWKNSEKRAWIPANVFQRERNSKLKADNCFSPLNFVVSGVGVK